MNAAFRCLDFVLGSELVAELDLQRRWLQVNRRALAERGLGSGRLRRRTFGVVLGRSVGIGGRRRGERIGVERSKGTAARGDEVSQEVSVAQGAPAHSRSLMRVRADPTTVPDVQVPPMVVAAIQSKPSGVVALAFQVSSVCGLAETMRFCEGARPEAT